MTPKLPNLDPILAALTVQQLALVEDQLTNNEASSNEEMQSFFVEAGLTEEQAKQALSYRDRYLLNMYRSGDTPILKGDDAMRFNPHTKEWEREGAQRGTLPPPKSKKTRKR